MQHSLWGLPQDCAASRSDRVTEIVNSCFGKSILEVENMFKVTNSFWSNENDCNL
ncbi:MAG: hypothetical protein AAF383_23130 [Cyanobacteria bacterium P01_A01_bin.83]